MYELGRMLGVWCSSGVPLALLLWLVGILRGVVSDGRGRVGRATHARQTLLRIGGGRLLEVRLCCKSLWEESRIYFRGYLSGWR